jgi:hypothetical protein
MRVELWSAKRVKPYEKNPRLNDDAVDAVAQSIREFGFRQPIVVDAEGIIIFSATRATRPRLSSIWPCACPRRQGANAGADQGLPFAWRAYCLAKA